MDPSRRRASSDDEPPSLAWRMQRRPVTPSSAAEPPPSSETEGEPPRRRGSSTPFDPVLGSLSLSTSIATSAASAAAAATGAATGAVPPRRSTGATSTGTYGPHIHERRSAFRRTFSEEPEPLPSPFAGLARLFMTVRERRRSRPDGASGKDVDALALEGAEEGRGAEGGGGGGGGGRGAAGDLRELRARYVTNISSMGGSGDTTTTTSYTNNFTKGRGGGGGGGGVHDLVRHQMDSVMDDPWIESIRAQDFLMKLAVALQRYGSPVPRTEAILAALADKLRVDGQFYLLPNLLLASFGLDSASETHMVRCPQDFDAYRYRKTSHLVRLMLQAGEEGEGEDENENGGKDKDTPGGGNPQRPRIRTVPEAVAKLEAIVNSPPLYPKAVLFLCHVVSAAAAALVFWRGDFYDAAVAAVSTIFVALVVVPGSDHFFLAKVQVLLSAILTGVVSTVGSTFMQAPCSKAIFYSPITFLLTGWSLTFSLMEFSMSAALLGTTRMANALVTGLLLGYGIQIGHDICYAMLSSAKREALHDWATSEHCTVQPWYVQVAAFPFIGIPYAILLHAAPAQWPAMALSAGGAVALMNGALAEGPEHLAVFFGALCIGVFGNLYARATGSPALIVIVNATFMLTPGSMAVTSAKSYLDQNLAQGWNTAVSMLLIAISIAAGLLTAQGLVLGIASLGDWWCGHCGGEALQRQKRRERRLGPLQGGIDSVYF